MEANEHRVESKTFWIIALPKTVLSAQAFEELKAKAGPFCAMPPRPMKLPQLRVGTLDSLMQLSDELVKKDVFVEMTVKKIARQLVDLVVDDEKEAGGPAAKGKGEKIPLVVNGVNLDTYLQQFVWDEAKYKLSSPLSDVVDAVVTTVSKLDEELRTKNTNYQGVTQALAANQRKKTGNLVVRDLAEYLSPETYIDTPNLATVFVIIPKHQAREWAQTYESLYCCTGDNEDLGGGVIPESSTLITEDGDNQLYSIVVFKRVLAEWKVEARKKKFNVREYSYNPESLASGVEEKKKLDNKRIKQKKNLIRWCRLNFAEAFISWTHLKAVRIYVETILRYGLPADFTAVLLEPARKHEKKLRTTIDTLYKSIGSAYLQDDAHEEDDNNAAMGQEKFYSYVFTEMRVSL